MENLAFLLLALGSIVGCSSTFTSRVQNKNKSSLVDFSEMVPEQKLLHLYNGTLGLWCNGVDQVPVWKEMQLNNDRVNFL